MSVPLEIVAGNTEYAHVAERFTDLYVPKQMVSNPPPEHTWRYCVAKAQGNTVYFSNKKSGASVWILPDINATDPNAVVVMKTRGLTESAASKRPTIVAASSGTSAGAAATDDEATATTTAQGATASSTGAMVASASSSSVPSTPAVSAPGAAAALHTTTVFTPPAASGAQVAAAVTPDSAIKSIQDKLQEAIRQKLAAKGITPSTFTLPSGAATTTTTSVVASQISGDPVAAAPSSLTAVAAASPPTTTAAVSDKAAADTSGTVTTPVAGASSGLDEGTPGRATRSPGGVRDRIAAWRAGKAGGGASVPRQSRSSTPQPTVGFSGEDSGTAGTTGKKLDDTTRSNEFVSSVERDALPENSPVGAVDSRSGRDSVRTGLRKPTPVAGPTAATTATSNFGAERGGEDDGTAAVLQRAFYEEKRRQMVLEDEQLRRQKDELVRAERAALERQRLAIEARAAEEENYARIVAERRRMEEQRLAMDLRERQRLAALAAREEAAVLSQKAASEIDHFAKSQEAAAEREAAAKRRAQSFAEAVTQSLLEAAVPRAEQKGNITAASATAATMHRSITSSRHADSSRANDDSDTSDSDRDTSANATTVRDRIVTKRPKRQSADVRYTPSLRYVGTVGGGPSPLLAKYGVQAAHHAEKHSSLMDEKDGEGTYTYQPDGAVRYEGRWKRDQKHGNGDMVTDTSVYEGQWKHGRIHGKGLLQTQGVKASVEAREGRIHGNVVVQASTGDTVVGRVEQNEVTSPVALALSSGDTVEWKWTSASSRGSGECRIQFYSGDSYVGGVEHFLLHGNGAFCSAAGHEYVGEFRKGFMEGRGFFRFANGNTYEGELRGSLFHGRGVYHCKGEYTYEGDWVNGAMHGVGTVTYHNGDVWQGEFERDQRRAGKYVASSLFRLS